MVVQISSVPCEFCCSSRSRGLSRERGVATSIDDFCAVGCATAPGLTNDDRWFFVQMYCWFPLILQVLTIVRPETLVCWRPGQPSLLLVVDAGRSNHFD